MSSLALEPRTFRDTTSLANRIWTSRAASLLMLFVLSACVVMPAMTRGRLFPRPAPYVATMQHATERLRAGELPLWNPHEHLGEPLARDGRCALWYPATLLHLLLPQPLAWQLIAILHLWLAGVGAWMLAGRYGLEPVPRLMSGAAYLLCGMMVLGLEHAQANVLVWLPWAALAVERLSERVTATRILLASLVLTIQFLGGDALASAALVVTCTLALLVRAFWIGLSRLASAIVASALALAIAVAGSAVQWMMAGWAWRANPLAAVSDLARAWPWGMGLSAGDATAPALVGTVPLVLAVIAVTSGRRPRAVVLWSVIGVVLALTVTAFEFGGHILGPLPRPRVLAAGSCLAVAVLAGFGIETVVALAAERAARVRATLLWVAAAIVAIAVVVSVVFMKKTDPAGARDAMLYGARLVVGAAMVCAAALIVRSQELPQWRSRGWPWVALACAELLAFALPAMRGVAIRDLGDVSDVAAFFRGRAAPARYIEATARLPEAFATWQSLEDAGGAGRGSDRHDAWSTAAGGAGGRVGPDALRVAAVRYLVTDSDAPPPPQWKAVHRNGSLTIYADADPMPRAWVAPEGRRVTSPADALAPIASTQPIDPRQLVLLDDVDADAVDRALIDERPGFWSYHARGETGGDVTYVPHSPEDVRVRVRQGSGGWLIVSDGFANGWRATIHDVRQPLVAAFGAFRAVPIPPGSVEVVFTYDPAWWRYAVLTSGAGWIVMLLLLAWSLLGPRRKRAELPVGFVS